MNNSEPFQTTSGQIAYQKYVPNRVALGIPMTAKGEGDWIRAVLVNGN